MTKLCSPLSIILTETHLSDSVLNAEVSIPGYALFRSDREGRTHGGTCAYVRNDLAPRCWPATPTVSARPSSSR